MPTTNSKASKRILKDEEEASFREPRWVNVIVMAILVMTGLSLFYETQAIHSQAFQALLAGKIMTSDGSITSTTALTTTTSRSLEETKSQSTAISAGQYPPFSCPKLLNQLRTKAAMQKMDPNKGFIRSRRTLTQPPFYMSVHDKAFDITRWVIMDTGEYYEKRLTDAFVEVLKESPSGARVLDVGANIGFFSLLSAAQGRFTVDSFEPNIKNRMRFCESLNLNRWFRTEFNNIPQLDEEEEENDGEGLKSPTVNLYPYGVGAEEGNFIFREDANPGMGSVSKTKTTADKGVRIVTLDAFAKERGWFDSRPHIAILKIDVEGNEYQVIEGAKELLKTNMVHNIFMEVSVRTKPERKANIPCLQYLSGPAAGYRLHRVGSWPGPGRPVNWPHDDQLVNRILNEADKEGAKQLNLWWKKIHGHAHRTNTTNTAAGR